jgi:NAD(P)-dependent dehydrogenase (short-subunit alcohol dehydrogenase family)
MKLSNRVAIVTGGGSGIGRATCLGLASEGAQVAVIDLYLDRAEQVASEVKAMGRKAIGLVADVGYADQVENAFTEIIRYFGKINILVNNAGTIRLHYVVDTPEEEWDEVIRVNLKSVFLCSKLAARQMLKQGNGGRIINVTSIHAAVSEPNASAYTASKGGIESFTRTLATELAKDKITANCVRPGSTWSTLTTPLFTPPIVEALKKRIPVAEIAQPEWISSGILFLASDEACYITGTVLTIDGGYIMDGSVPGTVYK